VVGRWVGILIIFGKKEVRGLKLGIRDGVLGIYIYGVIYI